MVKRICLFAGYSANNKIENYVSFYLKALSEYADVYYCADNDLSDEEIDKIRPFIKEVFYGKHSMYDFGSWAKIISALGWEKIESYDELILTNDSLFGPLYPLSSVFEQMDKMECDAWSLAKNKFLMSFFLCVKKPVIQDEKFRQFFQSLTPSQEKGVFLQYEVKLSDILSAHRAVALLDKKTLKEKSKRHKKEIRQIMRQIIPAPFRWFLRKRFDKIRLYDNEALFMPLLGFPFFKKNAFVHNESLIPIYGLKFVEHCTDYDKYLISDTIHTDYMEKFNLYEYVMGRLRTIIARNKYHLLRRFNKALVK